jgi:serine/threonine protein kinase
MTTGMGFPKEFRWKKIRALGSGGQATVFEVEDSRGVLPERYALKPLKNGAPTKAYERFYREISAITALDHPGVIKVIEHSDREAEFHYYVMELIPGATTLKKLLNTDQNPFSHSAKDSLQLFWQLVDVVGAAKRAGIVHRDLKPANILILPDRTVKVIDFGVCQIEGASTITLLDEGVGAINYMAPECESGASGEIDFRSDLYSAGKVLWAAVANQNAFAREKPAFNDKSMYSLSRSTETWHLHRIFEGTIRHNPNNRFPSIEEAIRTCRLVNDAIKGGYPPLESLINRCPICGIGELATDPGYPATVTHPYRNPLPNSLVPMKCNYCTFWQIFDRDKLITGLKNRTSLE